jgi:diguanylate cyclase (GGDEF)-like protein
MKTGLPSKVICLDGYSVATKSNTNSIDVTRLALKLQQTIELTPLLQSFCQETARIIPCDSVRYQNNNNVLNYQTGETQAHLCRYQLELEGDSLGEIECTRQKPFSIRETDQMEHLLSLLVYPLRNALLYQKAVAEAHKDPLTQISNRAAFDEALNREICSFKRHDTNFSLMMIDIDFFKNVNDTYGHIAGDKVIKSVSQVISKTLRRSDEVFRYGGEEFVVLLSNTNIDGAQFIAERVRREIKKMTIHSHEKINITASIGIASSCGQNDVADTLYLADKALYQAKEAGRDRVVVTP